MTIKQIALPLFIISTATAQTLTLTLSSTTGTPGEIVDLSLTIGGPTQATGLQWTLTYPAADLSSITFSLGEAASGAGKSLQCVSNNVGKLTCLLFGVNQTPMGPGVVATFSAGIAVAPPDHIVPLTLSGIAATDSAGDTIPITGMGGIVTVPGVAPGALAFIPVAPCRIADTRNPIGPFGGPELVAGTSRDFLLANSACGIPSGAVAYSLNVTVVPDAQLGYLTIWPSGQQRPYVSRSTRMDGSKPTPV